MNRRKRFLKRTRGHDRTSTPLKGYPYGALHSLPTFTRPYFNVPMDDVPASLYDRYADPEIPLHPHSTPTCTLRHKYSSMRDERFRKVQGQLEHHRLFHHAGHDRGHDVSRGQAQGASGRVSTPTKTTLTAPCKSVQEDSFSMDERTPCSRVQSLSPLPLHLDAPTSAWRREMPEEWLHVEECKVSADGSVDSIEEIQVEEELWANLRSTESCSAKGSIELDSLLAPSDTSLTCSDDSMESVEDLGVQWMQDLLQEDPNLFTSPRLLPSPSTLSMHAESRLEFWLVTKVLIWILAWWICSSVIFTLLEEGWTLVDGLYFTFETMTTIGYGDLSLRSPLSWEFWYLFIFNGVSGWLTQC